MFICVPDMTHSALAGGHCQYSKEALNHSILNLSERGKQQYDFFFPFKINSLSLLFWRYILVSQETLI